MADSPRKLSVLAGGLAFGEGPRWRERRLWLSDMHAHRVVTVDEEGRVEEVVRVAGRPSGLGWLPDGRMLVVSMEDRKLLRYDGGSLATHADLSGEVLERIPTETQAIACMLGGADRRTLFVLTAETTDPGECSGRKGSRVETARVDVPGAGLP